MSILLGLILVLLALFGAPIFILLGGGALLAFFREGISSSAVIAEMSRLVIGLPDVDELR